MDRSGRTYEEYRQLYWDEKERRKELEAELTRMKQINKENGDYAEELQVQLDNHRAQTDHWLTMLDKAEAQLEAVRGLPDKWCCAEWSGHDNNQIAKECADELQAALKGEES